jgi:hypothetical protein
MWRFRCYGGREDETDDARSCRPSVECTNVKVEVIALLRSNDHRIRLRVTALPPNIGQYTVRSHGNGAKCVPGAETATGCFVAGPSVQGRA